MKILLGLLNLKMDAESIADTLLSTAQEWGLLLFHLVAQGYDG